MHVALIIDEDRLAGEGPMLARLAAGLVEGGVQVTAVLPEGRPLPESRGGEACATKPARLEVKMGVPPWMRRPRALHLAAALEAAPPDLLHAVGEKAWKVGLDVARVIDRPVTLDLFAADQVQRAPDSRTAPRLAAYIVPTEPIAEALRQRVGAELVSVVPLGVLVPTETQAPLADPEKAIALAIIGTGRDIAAYRAMLTGLSRLTREFPQIQACLELRGPSEHEIWRHARRLDLLGHISAIVDAALHRPLLTGCDVLIAPERIGHVRSVLLQAMAVGMPLVVGEDPFLDMLVPDQTAIVIREADPEEWATQLRRLLAEPQLAHNLGASAREWVASRHRVSDQVSKLMAAFEQVLSGGAHTFVDTAI